MIVIFICTGAVPDVLIEKFFGVFGIEGILCAVITVVKELTSKLIKQVDDDEEDADEFAG